MKVWKYRSYALTITDSNMNEEVLKKIASDAIEIYNKGFDDGFRTKQASRSYSQDLSDMSPEEQSLYAKQREERGFDDSEFWSFSETMSRFLVDRLKVLKTLKHGCPRGMTPDEYEADIDAMIEGFTYSSKEITEWCGEYETVRRHQIIDAQEKAVALLHKHFFNLYGFTED